MKLQTLINSYSNLDSNDIMLILEQVLNIKYSRLFAMDDISLSLAQQGDFDTMVKRLSQDEPVQYILGEWDFIDLTLKVDKRALIPRPETEQLAEFLVEYANGFDKPNIIDLGCGTGCIGLYAKSKMPNANVTLLDISEDALDLAEENAKKLNIDVNFVHQDMTKLSGKYHIIVSNPPYISCDVVKTLDKSVKNYEPLNALDGGDDGLDFYRALSNMNDRIYNGGYLMMEIGYDQGKSVSKLLEKNFDNIKVIKDITGNDRIVIGRKKQ